MQTPHYLIVDLFCGAGGVTTGFEMAGNNMAKVIACVNHDPKAIESHWQNHPDVRHFEEDIRTLDVGELCACTRLWQRLFPSAKLILWASLECTNFSKAKGGKARNADSRTLAHHLFRYIDSLCPDMIMIENVEEFMSWGPLCEKGKPISKRNGVDYQRWVNRVQDYGYGYDWRILNSADFGAYTARSRYFGLFAKEGMRMVFPVPTHAKKPEKSLFGALQKWMPVKDVLDFSDEGRSIFIELYKKSKKAAFKYLSHLPKKKKKSKKKTIRTVAVFPSSIAIPEFGMEPKLVLQVADTPISEVEFDRLLKQFCQTNSLSEKEVTFYRYTSLSEKTLERIYAGLVKYACGPVPVDCKPTDLDRNDLDRSRFFQSYYGNGAAHPLEEPCPTLSTKDRFGIVKPEFLHPSAGSSKQSGNYWLDTQFSSGQKCRSVDQPCGTLLTVPKLNLCTAHWLDKQYGSSDPIPSHVGLRNHQSIDEPAGVLKANPPFALMEARFIMPTHFNNKPQSVEEPCSTITANRKWHYLVNPSWYGHAYSVDQPSPVVIARQDKAPLYLVVSESGQLLIRTYPSDSGILLKIKEFMATHKIVDIKMRMLKVTELMKIQGFPTSYKLAGNQTEQKKFIGNSVVPHVVKAWIEQLDASQLNASQNLLQSNSVKKNVC